MKLINRNDLRNLLFSIKGAKIVTITTKTTPKLIGGKSCPYKGVEKIAVVNGTINYSYENSVNRQRTREDKEADFQSQARVWGKQLFTENANSRTQKRLIPFVVKKWNSDVISEQEFNNVPENEIYLNIKVERSLDYKYVMNGKEVDKSEVNGYLPRPSSNTQDVDKEVMPRNYLLTNITEITVDGETYKIAA